MIKTTTTSVYRITPSLLNAWRYIDLARDSVREAESDTMCLEDKQALASKKALESFLKTLSRVKEPPTEAMQRGINFERECYEGKTCISPIIKNGSYQIGAKKYLTINGLNFELYGILDVLKGGTIYDIKRVSQYSPQKYLYSYQHDFYLMLFKGAYQFKYLAYDGYKLHIETYYQNDSENRIIQAIKSFIIWLQANNLLETYKEHWNIERKIK